MQVKYYGNFSQANLYLKIFLNIYINMDKLEKLEKIKQLMIKKLELSNDARDIEMLNEKYIIIISMIYNYNNNIYSNPKKH